jgi:hypothetical protein
MITTQAAQSTRVLHCKPSSYLLSGRKTRTQADAGHGRVEWTITREKAAEWKHSFATKLLDHSPVCEQLLPVQYSGPCKACRKGLTVPIRFPSADKATKADRTRSAPRPHTLRKRSAATSSFECTISSFVEAADERMSRRFRISKKR